ncbi:MAG: PorT family protein [Cyclobacteriaceae bacterium]|nr:PorT family protein [Cyclobacteriaceae bacterium]
MKPSGNNAKTLTAKGRVNGKLTSFNLIAALVLMTTLLSFSQSSHVAIVVTTTDVNFNYGGKNAELKSSKENVRALRAGLSFQAGLTKHFSWVGELYYATKGGILNAGNGLTQDKSTLKLYSAELPLMARFHMGRFYLNTGPYASYIFSGRMTTSGPDAGSVSFNNTDGFKRFDWGWQAGAGYVFDVKKSKLAIDVRYGHGLTSLSRDITRYNQMLSISVSMFKSFKKNIF